MKTASRLVATPLQAGLLGTLLLSGAGQAQVCQTKVVSGDPNQNDRLGTVALEGDYFLAGAPGDSQLGLNVGAAYVFERNLGGTGAWGERLKITPSNPTNGAGFGTDLALNNSYAHVGAPFESSSGAVYIHQRVVNAWPLLKHIPAPRGLVNESFGFSVDSSSTRLLAGAPEVIGSEPGHAYVYEQNQGGFNVWGLFQTLQATPAVVRESFGWSVALDTNTAVIGAIGADDFTTNHGAAYVFTRNTFTGVWTQTVRLLPSSPFPSGFFGWKVAITGDFAFVAAPGENFDQGAVYIFWRFQGGPNAWGQIARVTAPQVTSIGRFGEGLDAKGNRVLVGERSGPDGGSAYLLEQNWGGTNNWGIVKRINADNFGATDEFGTDVCVAGTIAGSEGAVGAPRTPLGPSTFVGATYVLNLSQCSTAMPYGFCHTDSPCGNTYATGGCANTTGLGARLAASGSSSVALDDLVLTTTQMTPNSTTLHFMGPTMTRVPLGNGLRVTGNPIIRLPGALNSGPGGQVIYGPGIAASEPAIQPGTTWNIQTWYRDNPGPCGGGTNLSNGMSVSFVP